MSKSSSLESPTLHRSRKLQDPRRPRQKPPISHHRRVWNCKPRLSERSPLCGRSTRNRKPRASRMGEYHPQAPVAFRRNLPRDKSTRGAAYIVEETRPLLSGMSFCSAEHRELWQERESANLAQRLLDAGWRRTRLFAFRNDSRPRPLRRGPLPRKSCVNYRLHSVRTLHLGRQHPCSSSRR